MSNLPRCFLVDNGSLRAASTLNLRRVGVALQARIGAVVEPVSLLHSSGVDAAELDGVPARLLEPALHERLKMEPASSVVLLPFFFGPSAALTEYLPGRVTSLREKFPRADVRIARWLVDIADACDDRVARSLADAVRAVIAERALAKPPVVLTDHGSPQESVTAVRAHLAAQVRVLLGDEVAAVGAAAMERRAGPAYAFNDPLLADCLARAPFDRGEVVIALQFLSPGRHAGAAGDIAQICAAAERAKPGLKTWMTEPIGDDARVVAVLADRYREALAPESARGRSDRT